jgi:hypothetical protein
VFSQLKVVVDLICVGVTDAWSLKSKRDRRKAVLRMLESYFLLKDCLDDGATLILEAGSNPVATLHSMSAEKASTAITRWDGVLRLQGKRLYMLREYFLSQDHLAVVAPEMQEKVAKAVGSKFARVTTLEGIGASLVFYIMFPMAETPEEKAEYIVTMAGSRKHVIDIPKIKREVKALGASLDSYREVIEKLVSNEEIVRLSHKAREATRIQ